MPAPRGQSFAIEAAKAENRGGLEFAQYADLVRRHLVALGYAEAASPQAASFVVSLDYGVDQGRERVVAMPDLFLDPWSYGGFGGRGFYPRWGYGRHYSPFFWGWHDPFFDYDVTSYTLYTSYLDMNIRRTADGQSLFEGRAQARSQTNALPVLVPNLVEAMFTGFPGNSGEHVRITVMPERHARPRG
jgi:hypothetical protein